MAIIIRGKTICGLCGNPLNEGDAIVAFLPFVTNEADPLFQFNDAAFHERCFHNHPLAKQCMAEYAQVRKDHQDGHRSCDSCRIEIDNPDDYFTTGMITSKNNHPLHKYNGLQLHYSCMDEWEKLGEFHELLTEAILNKEVRGPGIDALVQEIESVRPLGLLFDEQDFSSRDKRWPKNAS